MTVKNTAFYERNTMEKQFADKMIEKYQGIFYGFALSKSYNIDEADELASRIVLEAYITLLKVDDIYNWDGYLYRIAQNVYARYVMEKKKQEYVNINDINFSEDASFVEEVIRSEEYQLIKREISWLGKLQRQIMYMHYFENQKIATISTKLDIPIGTVKWHLYDAKKIVKEGIEDMRNSGELGLKPIKFDSMGHIGCAGRMGDTKSFLNSRLRQNIVYAAYFEAKTIPEISKELGVSPVYVEDEVYFLEEYGFLDKLVGNKFLTNIFITNLPQNVVEQQNKIHREIARIICDEYVPGLIEKFKNYDQSAIFVPENDERFLLWNIVTVALGWMKWEKAFCNDNLLEGTHYSVKRKDGGEYIAHASVWNEEVAKGLDSHFKVCGDMSRNSYAYPIASWQLSTDFDNRKFGWEDNMASDYEALYLFMNDKLEKSEATLEKYKRLYDRGLIYNVGEEDRINVVVIKLDQKKPLNAGQNRFLDMLPKYSPNMIKLIKKKQEELWNIQKGYYPKHMHKLLKYYILNTNNRIMVLDELLERGIISPLIDAQKKGALTLVYSDTLPETV